MVAYYIIYQGETNSSQTNAMPAIKKDSKPPNKIGYRRHPDTQTTLQYSTVTSAPIKIKYVPEIPPFPFISLQITARYRYSQPQVPVVYECRRREGRQSPR